MLRRISWGLGGLSLLAPLAFFAWQWFVRQGRIADGATENAMSWLFGVLAVNLSVAGLISFFALLTNALSLYRLTADPSFRPLPRMLEMVLLALPLLICLFFFGAVMTHG
ncbi:1,4-dihydroxy-2-naphthoate prenyltransferase [Leminorella grimontii]|uniref:1,4-dihydroxy-2-naphthoate prenyltransferase n=1 Tax=Leminorella grimontii TaxID=82981 RepID=UPI0032201321